MIQLDLNDNDNKNYIWWNNYVDDKLKIWRNDYGDFRRPDEIINESLIEYNARHHRFNLEFNDEEDLIRFLLAWA